jgi:hypothetical protein
MLLFGNVITFGVISDNTTDPEIIDDENDVYIAYPKLINILYSINILDQQSFEFLDIISAWFYEIQSEPGFLFTSIKLKDLNLPNQRVVYTIRWTYDGSEYCCCTHILNNGDRSLFSISSDYVTAGIDGSIDYDKNTITYKIPKESMGNPKPGDILSHTNAWVGLRFSKESLFTVAIGELALDYSNYGRDYVVQY